MKNFKRLLSLALTAVLIFSLICTGMAVSAATPVATVSYASPNATVEVEAGQTVKINVTEDPCTSLQANYSYSNKNLFSSVTSSRNTSSGSDSGSKFTAFGVASPTNVTFTLTAVVNTGAAVGDKCVITFSDCRHAKALGGLDQYKGYTLTVTVVVKAPVPTSSSTTKPTSSSTTKPTVSTKPSVTTKKPTTGLDFTELNKAIAAGEALVAADYTADSWANYETALQAAIAARNAKKQADNDAATNALKAAQAALVKAAGDNKAELENYIQTVKKFLEEDKLSVAYKLLNEAVSTAEAAVAGGSKEEIDAAYSKLKAAFEAYKKAIDDLKTTETIEVEKVVEKDPEGPFCNIFCHKLLLILLIISLILNVLFVIYFVYLRKQKENETKPAASSSDDDDASDILR